MIKYLNTFQVNEEFVSHIVAFSVAEYGAQGEALQVLFLTDSKDIYEVTFAEETTIDKLFEKFPVFERCIMGLQGTEKIDVAGWRHTYMGVGNHLFMAKRLHALFFRTVGQDIAESEIYRIWMEVAQKILYRLLVEDVKQDYKTNNEELVWCDLCDEINFWTYWQGRGNTSAEILLVGQDWGCVFDENFEQFKSCIEKMNAGDNSVDYAADLKFPTDKNLIELFEELGYDLHKKNKNLFFTNLALGYRKHSSTGTLSKECLKKDTQYLKRLLGILRPKVVICLGKDTYEVAASALCETTVRTNNFYAVLNRGDNYSDFYLENREKVRVYGMAHCGNYGVMNRKKYAEVDRQEDGLELQKQDWLKLREYLESIGVVPKE